MVGTATLLEGLLSLVPNIVALTGNTKKDVLPDRSKEGHQYINRSIQNLTGQNLYVAFDCDADNAANYHFVVANNGILVVTSLARVSCFSVAGGNVATLEQRRVRGT